MAVKVFILGRPGSGKSTAAHRILDMARCHGWCAIHIKDYDILQEMFQADLDHKKFRPTTYGGFDVLDFSVLNVALQELEQRAQAYMPCTKLIILEFARDDYSEALKWFSRDFLRDAYFLFTDADVETCIQRIHHRISYTYATASKSDNHFVSDEILRTYYSKDIRPYVTSNLRADYGISKKIELINNTDSWEDFVDKVSQFANMIFCQEFDSISSASGDRS